MAPYCSDKNREVAEPSPVRQPTMESRSSRIFFMLNFIAQSRIGFNTKVFGIKALFAIKARAGVIGERSAQFFFVRPVGDIVFLQLSESAVLG